MTKNSPGLDKKKKKKYNTGKIHNTWILVVLLQEDENPLHKHFWEAIAIYTQFICYLFYTAMHSLEVSKSP